jgi:hypothetical protein
MRAAFSRTSFRKSKRSASLRRSRSPIVDEGRPAFLQPQQLRDPPA